MEQQSFDNRAGKIWYDGEFEEWKDSKIHILNHGLHYGSSVFEGIRVYDSQAFKLKEHMERLHASAKYLKFEIPYSVNELVEKALELIKKNNVKNGYMRPIAWRGCETMLIGGNGTKIHTAIAVWESFEIGRVTTRERGINMCISSWRKPSADSSPCHSKAASIYTLATIIKIDAQDAGFDDALMLDSADNITEATTSNFFAIINNELHTPIPDCFLNGITRQTIIQVAKAAGIKVYERHIKVEELKKAEACFLTGTAIEIMPVKKIDNLEFNINHTMILKLSEEFSKLTNLKKAA